MVSGHYSICACPSTYTDHPYVYQFEHRDRAPLFSRSVSARLIPMDSLPPELLSHILLCLPRDCYPVARRTCHAFNAVLAPPLFSHLRGFLDLRAAEDRLARGTNNPLLRPVTIWSPESWPPPDMVLNTYFLSALYSALTHQPCGRELDGETFGALVGLGGLTGGKLRRVQFMYEMYLEYVDSDVFMLDSRTATTLEMMISK